MLRRLVARSVAVALVLAVLSGCTLFAPGNTLPASGGEVALPDDARVRVIVPPGAVSAPVSVEIGVDDRPPAPNPGTTPLGTAVDVVPSAPVSGATVRLPVVPAEIGPRRGIAIYVYSESLGVWIPLPTEWRGSGEATAVTPHFSRFQVFSFDVGDAAAGAAGAVGGAAHDAYGGVKHFAGGVVDGLHNWWEGGEQETLDCSGAVDGWTVDSEAREVTGCVVDVNATRLNLRSTYRVPLEVAGPTGTDIGLDDGDFELGMQDFLLQEKNAALGLGTVGSRGATSIGLPPDRREEGATIDLAVAPDYLGLTWGVIDSLLSFIPNKKKVTDQVDRTVMTMVREQRGSAVTVTAVLENTRVAVERTVTDSESLATIKNVISAWKCATERMEAGGTTVQQRDAEETAREIIEVAKECTGDVLNAADSAMKEVWDVATGMLDGVQAVRQAADAIKMGGTHWAGEFAITARLAGPPTLGVQLNDFSVGLGDVRPTTVDFGGHPTTVVTDIDWRSWGGDRAVGSGSALWVPVDAPTASGESEPVEVVAFDPGQCGGERVYRKISWYFPQHGETDDSYPMDTCTAP